MRAAEVMTDHAVTFRTLLKVSLVADNLPGLHGVPCPSNFCRSDFGFSLAANEMWRGWGGGITE